MPQNLLSDTSVLRIVLLGKTGAGKTALINTILKSSKGNEPATESQVDLFSETVKCNEEKVQIGEQEVLIVDTPGLCHAEKEDSKVIDEIKKGLTLCAPGPHVFLFVWYLGVFTQKDKDMVEMIWKTFGEISAQYTMVVFTNGNELKRGMLEEFINKSQDLKSFVSKCKGGYHVVDNSIEDPSQVTELLQKITDMVQKNKENPVYTNKMLENVGKYPNNNNRKKVAMSVNGGAVLGGGVGALTTYLSGGPGLIIGAVTGAGIGGVLGAVGIVVYSHIKAKTCMKF